MLLISCPHCGPRNDSEFSYLGGPRDRPDPGATKEQWRRYLYSETNTAGWVTEQWLHGSGCRRLLIVERNTVTHEVRSVLDVADAR